MAFNPGLKKFQSIDTLTHIVTGACIGEAIAGKKLGKTAMLWGAAAQSIPDLDFIAAFWLSIPENLLAHRGFTHSFLFAVVITGLCALLAQRWHKKKVALKLWMLLFGVNIFTHLLLDVFNSYGTGLFEPFSHQRVALDALFVADPFFSIFPFIGFVALLILKRRAPSRKRWWQLSLLLSGLYLGYCIFNKVKINNEVRSILQKKGIAYQQFFTTPTPLNNWLWFVAAGDSSGFYVGYRSVWDTKDEMDLQYFPRNRNLLRPVSDHEALQHLVRFSKGFYTVEKWHDTLVFNDLRFGQMIGWHDPKEKFVFHYFIQHPNDNVLVVQRGRFAKWDRDVLLSLVERIRGN